MPSYKDGYKQDHHVHKSAKDYDRQAEIKRLREIIQECEEDGDSQVVFFRDRLAKVEAERVVDWSDAHWAYSRRKKP